MPEAGPASCALNVSVEASARVNQSAGLADAIDDGGHWRGREFEVGVFIGEIPGHAVAAKAAGEEDGAVENGNHGGDVLGAFEAERGGELEGDDVAGLPDAFHGKITGGLGGGGLRAAVDGQRDGAGQPVGNAEVQRGLGGTGGADDGETNRVGEGRKAFLFDRQALGGPVERGRDVEIHPELAGALEVDALVIAGGVFDARADATVGAVEIGAEVAVQGREISHRAGVGGDGGEQVVVEGAFEVVGVVGTVRRAFDQARGELQHVLRVAALGGGGRQAFAVIDGGAGLDVRAVEPLVVGVAADGEGVVAGDDLPKIFRGAGVSGIAGDVGIAGDAGQLGDVGVGVEGFLSGPRWRRADRSARGG